MSSIINIPAGGRTTSANPVVLGGVGLHSGKDATVRVMPGKSGLRVADGGTFIALRDVAVARTPRCTRLELPSGRRIDMVEHLFAALRIAGITDADMEFDGDEVPVLDGSSAVWLEAFAKAGARGLDGSIECLLVVKPTSFETGPSRFTAMPGQFSLDCTIDFPNAHIGRQSVRVDERSLVSLATARTFVLEHEIALLKANNLALGGSLDNAVVIGEAGPLNPGGFRVDLECARHKALDFVGDLMVVGVPVIGRFEVFAPGHSANNAFVHQLLSSGALRRVSILEGNPVFLAA
ncbi:UDP-3-O-acyl-N-acetylglucosamine deacetylase [Pararhizobium sp. BT-229]|uniref:UDP-3-O-acyl-N-acetylglucosamine deacetylase n=1 Tax=Pararhizobium sp. BT-229 TaxID=2986923 RepID=UPI0021F7BE2B|nr:UDP-3-O-acyl-N-acetylglucosamine deacetylase [Pararhizobium sp. BT-229]MCV9963710.1 UDP-3-O-acyl-N-acetylglucosamine deacetylase [Pararhizobium sp. BT-229]